MKYFNLVIDCTNLFWRSACAGIKKRLNNKNHKLYSSVVQDSLDRIKQLKKQFGYNDSIIYCLFDNPLSQINIRKVLSEGRYKSSRDSDNKPKGFDKFLQLFMKVLEYYDNYFYICNLKTSEADDLVNPLLNYIKLDKDKLTLLISADLDWARGIDEDVHWFNYKNIYDIRTFRNDYKFSPFGEKIKIYKSIHGDASDCIKNAVPHLPHKTLLDIVNAFDDLNEVFKNLHKIDCSDTWKNKILEAESKIKINYNLVDYIDIDIPISRLLTKCNENIETLRLWYDILEIPYETRMKKKRVFWGEKTKYRGVR
jgi:hypothetical protein